MIRQSSARRWLAVVGLISLGSLLPIWSQPFSDTADTIVAANANPDKTLQDLRRKASSGHLHEELELAGDYYIGKGVARDIVQAAYWYKKAADQGDPGAQVEIGYFYLTGTGVKQDDAEALRWFDHFRSHGKSCEDADSLI